VNLRIAPRLFRRRIFMYEAETIYFAFQPIERGKQTY
jgi:hypothetical protein